MDRLAKVFMVITMYISSKENFHAASSFCASACVIGEEARPKLGLLLLPRSSIFQTHSTLSPLSLPLGKPKPVSREWWLDSVALLFTGLLHVAPLRNAKSSPLDWTLQRGSHDKPT